MTKSEHQAKHTTAGSTPHMNPENSKANNSTPPPPSTSTPSNSSNNSPLINKLKALNGPQKALLLIGAVMLALVLTLAIYQTTEKDKSPIPATPAVIPQADVGITKNGFTPSTITVKSGTQITWTNQDSKPHQVAADPHPIHDSIEGFENDTTLLAGDTFSFIFETSGTYTLHDHLNPLDEKYRLTVVVE